MNLPSLTFCKNILITVANFSSFGPLPPQIVPLYLLESHHQFNNNTAWCSKCRHSLFGICSWWKAPKVWAVSESHESGIFHKTVLSRSSIQTTFPDISLFILNNRPVTQYEYHSLFKFPLMVCFKRWKNKGCFNNRLFEAINIC